jgi:hypothetical protein
MWTANKPRLLFSRHAVSQMFARSITPADVVSVATQGEVIASYPDEEPYPKRLLLGHLERGPLHVVVADDAAAALSIVVTTYRPDPEHWEPDWRTRRRP